MKYDVLHAFREWLDQDQELAANTKKKYYQSVKNVLANTDFDRPDELSPEVIERGIKALKTKNDVSAAKRGFEYFARYCPELRLPDSLGEISKHKRNYKKRKWEPLDLDKLQRTINSLSNKKLKYAYRLMLATGLRVSEVEQIRKQDITIEGDEIQLFIASTKNGSSVTVGCQEPYLIEKLTAFLSDMEDHDKVFYSASTMQTEAQSHGFECHDLRRSFAKMKYRELKPEIGSYRAVGEVRELLRHQSCRTTKIYLRRKII